MSSYIFTIGCQIPAIVLSCTEKIRLVRTAELKRSLRRALHFSVFLQEICFVNKVGSDSIAQEKSAQSVAFFGVPPSNLVWEGNKLKPTFSNYMSEIETNYSA